MPGLKILIVDDHALFRSGLCFLLEGLGQEIEIVEAGSCEQALEVCEETTELVLLDYHLPDCNGDFDALKKIKTKFPSSTVVVLSSEDDQAIIRGAVELGAAGFIPKSSTPSVMITALKSVLAGGIYLPAMAFASAKIKDTSANTSFAIEGSIPLDQSLVSQLSGRQLEVLTGAIKGKPNKVIARELNIAEGTVKAHLSIAYRVINVKNRTEAVYLAAKLKFGL
ncbi:MAG: response regulator transcription factor [Arenicella sp.]|nr:response regulator transcription factor [Arenicella sp.]